MSISSQLPAAEKMMDLLERETREVDKKTILNTNISLLYSI